MSSQRPVGAVPAPRGHRAGEGEGSVKSYLAGADMVLR
jgi:hypothetical protein